MDKQTIQKKITETLIAKLQEGVGPWRRSWNVVGCTGLPLRANGAAYKGINVLILSLAGRTGRHWFTYKQAAEVGGQVRGGEKGTQIVFFKPLTVQDKVTGLDKKVPLLRSYTVFNADQIDGLPARYLPQPPVDVKPAVRIAAAEAYVAATAARITHQGDRAFYRPSTDDIQVPTVEQFKDVEAYYGTVLHELVHWTGHETRCDRSLKTTRGTRDYAFEELVAEIGACFLTAHLGVEQEVRQDHAEYLASWLKVLKEDHGAIFRAAALSQKAVDHLDGLQPAEALAEAA